MSALHTRTCTLPHGYKVKFRFKANELFECEWIPEMPPKEIGRQLLPFYTRARNDFLASVGINIMVIDV